MQHKRVLTIQDYSIMGRCSLTIALPIISSCLVECIALPSCVLSNHTQFDSWELSDLTSKMYLNTTKWDKYDHNFDVIYTGYLLDSQIDETLKIIKKYNKPLLIVDPAMADNNSLYPGFDLNHISKMNELVNKASIVIPNLTELVLLTSSSIKDNYSEEEILFMLKKLSNNSKTIILTGVKKDNKNLIYLFNKNKLTIFSSPNKEGKYHGSGDLFASTFVGAYIKLNNLNLAIEIAKEVVLRSIDATIKENIDGVIYGLNFEEVIPYLSSRIKKEYTPIN